MKRKTLIYSIMIGLLLIGTITCELFEDLVKNPLEECGEDPRNSGTPTQAEIDEYLNCIQNL